MHHTCPACIKYTALPFVAFEVDPRLVQYDNTLPANAERQNTSCYCCMTIHFLLLLYDSTLPASVVN